MPNDLPERLRLPYQYWISADDEINHKYGFEAVFVGRFYDHQQAKDFAAAMTSATPLVRTLVEALEGAFADAKACDDMLHSERGFGPYVEPKEFQEYRAALTAGRAWLKEGGE